MEVQLKAIDHFSQLNDHQLQRLVTGSEIKRYGAGDRILSTDVSPDFYSFLIEGQWWMQRQIVGVEPPETGLTLALATGTAGLG